MTTLCNPSPILRAAIESNDPALMWLAIEALDLATQQARQLQANARFIEQVHHELDLDECYALDERNRAR